MQASLNRPGEVLIYDKKREILWEGTNRRIYDMIQWWFSEGALLYPKAYFRAHLEGTLISLDEVVDDQDW